MIDIDRPLFTKRGGVVTEFRKFRGATDPWWDENGVSGSDVWAGIETIRGVSRVTGWKVNFQYFDDTQDQLDLTNIDPNAVSPVEPVPIETPDLQAENEQLRARVTQLEKEKVELSKIVVKWQRQAAKGAVR